jgi:hypothetical protein
MKKMLSLYVSWNIFLLIVYYLDIDYDKNGNIKRTKLLKESDSITRDLS